MVVAADFDRQASTVEVRHGNGNWPGRRAARLFAEQLGPVVSPDLLQPGVRWQDLPKIAVSGPRPGWQEWSQPPGESTLPHIRFDTRTSAIAAARSGVGVLLASLPLCARELTNGKLVSLSDYVLEPVETYWFTCLENTVSKRQWDHLSEVFCEPSPSLVMRARSPGIRSGR